MPEIDVNKVVFKDLQKDFNKVNLHYMIVGDKYAVITVGNHGIKLNIK